MILHILFIFFFLSCLLSRLNTANYFIDIFNQLSFQLLISGIVLFFILFFLRRIKTSVVCFLICLLLAIDILPSCNNCKSLVKFNTQNDSKIRLMTFNTSYAIDSNLPKWFLYLEKLLIKNKSAKLDESENLESLKTIILTENPDIVLFQEISAPFKDKTKSLSSIFPYSFLVQYKFPGIANSLILSKYPFKEKTAEDDSIITKIIVDGTELDILSVHLYSSWSKRRFNSADKQIQIIKNMIKDKDRNLILVGDFNMTNISRRFISFLDETNLYTYTSYLHPTFTWPAYLPWYFGIQIDHILFSENIKMVRKITAEDLGSDHRALIVDLVF